jgi:hypothetical protein
MPRVTLKSSTIFISVGDRTEVYRSVDEVPPSLRKKLEESTNGIHSATILIADRRGREEIMRAIRGGRSNLKTRLTASLGNETPAEKFAVHPLLARLREFAEILIPGALGFLTWFLFSLKWPGS